MRVCHAVAWLIVHASKVSSHLFCVVQRVLRLKVFAAGKLVSIQEMQQSPQLLDAVLQRRPYSSASEADQRLLQSPSDTLHVLCHNYVKLNSTSAKNAGKAQNKGRAASSACCSAVAEQQHKTTGSSTACPIL